MIDRVRKREGYSRNSTIFRKINKQDEIKARVVAQVTQIFVFFIIMKFVGY